MDPILLLNQSNVVCGLVTCTFTIPTTGLYSFHDHSDIQPGSSLSVVIKKNGSPIATSSAPSAAQNHVELNAINIQCTANDAITVVFSSSAAIDAGANNVKSIVRIVQKA